MSESEFWDTTPRYLSARHKAYIKEVRLGWELARYAGFFAFKTIDYKGKYKRPSDLEKFPWESTRPRFAKQSREELEKFDRDADEVLRITQPEVYKKYMEARQAAAENKNAT